MPIIDTILLICWFGFIFYGFFFGLIRTFGVLVGAIVATVFASRFYLVVSGWTDALFFGHDNLGKILIFIIIFSLIQKIVSFCFVLIDGAFNILSIIPFLKTINRLAGAILGILVGGLVLGLILYISNKYAFIDTWFGKWLIDSQIAPILLKFNDVLLPLMPEVLKKVDGLI